MDIHATATLPITAVWPGQPYPRGATWDGEGVNFSLFSARADKVELCIFDPSGKHELQRIELRERTDEIWHCYLPEARPGLLYGYRVHGPYAPEKGDRFNPHKLLIERAPLERFAFRLPCWTRQGRSLLRQARQRRRHAQVPRDRPRLHLGRRSATARALA
jgi:hypothetical protein